MTKKITPKKKVEIIAAKKAGFVVFYCKDLVLRERQFKEDEKQLADDFCKGVNGSICPLAYNRH